MTTVMKDARTTLKQMSEIKHEVIRTVMDENIQRLLAECRTNEERAKLWERNPITGERLSNKYSNVNEWRRG